jgi:hypothetical protein
MPCPRFRDVVEAGSVAGRPQPRFPGTAGIYRTRTSGPPFTRAERFPSLHTMTGVNFHTLITRAGTKEGARPLFARLAIELVDLVHRGAVRDIHANPGDWGMDAFVGTVDEGGSVLVWQSKYFIDGIGKVQADEIRESFESCLKAAEREGYTVTAWTLCTPEWMDGPTTKWWDTWKKRMETKYELEIDWWHPQKLTDLLGSPEGRRVYDDYFGDGTAGARTPLDLESPPEGLVFDEMLFIRQLIAAEVDPTPAKYEFFNADLLRREVIDKGDERGDRFLEGVQEELYSLWSHRWQKRCGEGGHPLLPGFHSDVKSAIETLHSSAAATDVVPMRLVHRFGSMHQVVETGRAGWIRDFVAIVEAHRP